MKGNHYFVFIITIIPALSWASQPSDAGPWYGFNFPYHNPWERYITDLSFIESPFGVPVDFSYNETYTGFVGLNSVPGCPKSIDGYPWVYYGSPPRCYLTGYQGPCPNKRILLVEKGSPFGVCTCDCFANEPSFVGWTPDKKHRFCGGFFGEVYDKQRKTCYNLQQQGPCGWGRWLVMNKSGTGVTCVPECPKPLFYDYKSGFCTTYFPGGSGAGIGPFVPNQCAPQKKYSNILRKCIPTRPDLTIFVG